MKPLTEKQKEFQKSLEEVRDKKQNLEHEICKLIYQFQSDTGVKISNVDVYPDVTDIDNTGLYSFYAKIKIVL